MGGLVYSMDHPSHIVPLGFRADDGGSASLFVRLCVTLCNLKHDRQKTVPILADRDDVQRFERQGYVETRFNLRV